MTILITGAAGFIGSHLSEYLLNQGHRLIAVDNLITGSLDNLADCKNHPSFIFIQHDITQPLNIEEPIDQIYNLACPASPIDYQNIPLETLFVSAYGVKNLLDLAAQKKAVFLHTSTSEIYGDPLQHPQTESYFGNVNCIGPRSCYDEGKRFAESLIINYQKKYHLNCKIVRIFNTYGPKMRKQDGRVIPNFINQALEGKPITIYGDGSQTRSFCYVSDMIDGLVKMMATENFSGPVNLGNPEEYSMLELAEEIIKLTDSKSQIVFHPLPQDDPKTRCPDIALAKAKFNFSPKVGLEEGLKKTINWFKSDQSLNI